MCVAPVCHAARAQANQRVSQLKSWIAFLTQMQAPEMVRREGMAVLQPLAGELRASLSQMMDELKRTGAS